MFGTYIHTYKYNEAVRDGVVLDLRYEYRDIPPRSLALMTELTNGLTLKHVLFQAELKSKAEREMGKYAENL